MENNEKFAIQYDGSTYEIPKSSLDFKHGYAVVKYEVNENSCDRKKWNGYSYTLSGVIDEDYDTVLPFEGYYRDINVLQEGNVIAKVLVTGGCGDQSYIRYVNRHFKIEGKESLEFKEFDSWEHKVINDRTIKIDVPSSVLYDVVKGKYVSDFFSSIGDFKKVREDIDEKFAEAKLNIKYPISKDYFFSLVCFIDEKGKIRSPIFNTYTGTYIDTSEPNFSLLGTLLSIDDEIRQIEKYNNNVSIPLVNAIRI